MSSTFCPAAADVALSKNDTGICNLRRRARISSVKNVPPSVFMIDVQVSDEDVNPTLSLLLLVPLPIPLPVPLPVPTCSNS